MDKPAQLVGLRCPRQAASPAVGNLSRPPLTCSNSQALNVSGRRPPAGASGFLFAQRNRRDPFFWRQIMKTEDAKTLAESALDTLAAQLDAGRSASLTTYLARSS